MSSEFVQIKEEIDWEDGISEAAVREGLYEGHQIKNEVVLGPEEYQLQDIAFSFDALNATTLINIKQEIKQEENDDPEFAINGCLESKDTLEQNIKSHFKTEPIFDKQNNNLTDSTVKQELIVKPKIYKKITDIYPKKKAFFCDYCGKEFSIKQGLINHVRIHTGEKPHKCQVCGKRFTDYATLVRHRRTHTGEKRFSCKYCKKKFGDRYVLTNHKRLHTGEKPFSCDICEKRFKDCSILSKHKKNHALRPFSCLNCKKLFATEAQLITHYSVHEKSPHVCEICDKSFRSVSHLNSVHTEKRSFVCGICGCQFTQFSALQRHMKRPVCRKNVS